MAGTPIGTIYAELDLDTSRYTKSQQKLLQDATTTTLNIEQNFKNLGIKSSAEMDLMRQKIQNSYNMIANNAKATANDILRAEEAKNAKLKALNDQQYGAHTSLTDKIKKNWAEVAASAYLAHKAFETGKELIDASLQMERIGISMQAVTNNSTLAAREIAFLREESNRLGLDFKGTALEYTKFAAAAKNTALEGEAGRKVFVGMSEAITALKLTTQDANLIYMAMTQMMSKGKVSMEELRRQMGERLPGAIRLAAEGMGMTTMELIKQIETGKIMATELLPALAEQLHQTYGQSALEAAQSGQAEINRFNNTMFETKAVLGDAIMPIFKDIIGLLASGAPFVKEFVGGFKLATVDVIAFIDKTVTLLSNLPEFFGGGEKFKALEAKLTSIDQVAEDTKQSIYNSMNAGVESTKTSTELAAEKMKITAALAAEAAGKSSDKTTKAAEAAAKKQEKAWESGQKEYERIMDEEYAYAERTGNKELDDVEKKDAKKLKSLKELIAKKKISEKQYADGVALITENTEDRKQEIWQKGQDEYEKIMAEEGDFAITENERQINKIVAQEREKIKKLDKLKDIGRISEEQYQIGLAKIHENAALARVESEIKSNDRIATARYDMIKDIRGYEDEAYEYRLKQIEAEKQKRINDAGATAEAVILAEKWATDQIQLAFIQRGKLGDDWKNGILAALLEIERAHTTWGNTAYEVTKAFTDNAKTQLQTNLFNIWKGNLDDIEVDWQSMLDSVGQKFTSKLSDMVVEAAAKDIVLLFKSEWVEGGSDVLGIVNNVLGFAGDIFDFFGDGSGYSTGSGDWTDGLGFAKGGRVPGSPSNVDSVAAWLAPGEYVLPASLVQEVINQGRGGDTMLAHINPAEAAVLKMLGGSGTINPRTGLPEFSNSQNKKSTYLSSNFNADTLSQYTTALQAEQTLEKQVSAIAAGKGIYVDDQFLSVSSVGPGPGSWCPTGKAVTSGGDYYIIPVDLIRGGAYNPSYDAWFYPYLSGNALSVINGLQPIAAHSSWISSFYPGSENWGGIDYPNIAYFVDPSKYSQIYAGGYWRAPGSYPNMELAASGKYENILEHGGGDYFEWTLDPTTGGASLLDYGAPGGGGFFNIASILPMLAGIAVAPFTGGMSIPAVMGLTGAATFAGSVLGQAIAGGSIDWEQALMSGAISGLTAGATKGISQLIKAGSGMGAAEEASYFSTEEATGQISSVFGTPYFDDIGGMWQYDFLQTDTGALLSNQLLAKGLQSGVKWLTKKALSAVLGTAFGGDTTNDNGYMQVSYMGADDGGLLTSLADIMKSMQSQNQFYFSAAQGLDYVPYDGFNIKAHKGEAVITAQENKQRLRGGSGSITIPIHIENFYGDSEGINRLAMKVGDILDNYNRKGWRA